MAQEDKARTLRKVFQAKIAHLSYAEQRKLTEMLREMRNERISKLAQEAKRARPVQTNAMSNAVDMRGQAPPVSPRSIRDIRVSQPQQPANVRNIREAVQEQLPGRNYAQRAARIAEERARLNSQEFARPNFPPTENPSIYRKSLAGRLAESVPNRAADINRSVMDWGSQIPNRSGMVMELGDAAIGMAGRAAKRFGPPIIADLLMPSKYGVSNGEISGGDIYNQTGSPSYFTNATGSDYLPPHLQAANEQWRAQDQMLQQRQVMPSYHLDPNYHRTFSPVQLQGTQQQTYQEPQSIASTLATQEPSYEPQSIARQLSMEPVASQYTNAPQVSIAREVPEPGSAPASLMEHYVKIYGSPERAREAMLNTEAYKQSQIQ